MIVAVDTALLFVMYSNKLRLLSPDTVDPSSISFEPSINNKNELSENDPISYIPNFDVIL